MKKILSSLGLMLLLSQSIQALDASISYSTFKSPTQNYIEVYLFVLGNTVEFVPLDSSLSQAGVEVVILFKQGETIVKFDKYHLTSPASAKPENFADLKRFALENGTYEIEVSINDLNKEDNVMRYEGKVIMDYSGEGLLQSDIQLLSVLKKADTDNTFVKNGYYMETLPYHFYNKSMNKLIFYNEIYNADQVIGDDFKVSYGIEQILNEKTSTVLIGHKKRKARATNVLLLQMNITDLPSGNYLLFVEIRNRANELLSRKTTKFQRSNPYLQATAAVIDSVSLNDEFVSKLTAEELRYSLKAIAPLVKDGDVELLNAIILNKELEAQRRFLFNFWVGQDPNQAESSYRQFMEVAKAVDRMYFSGFGYGFESDRGFIYIRYGRPDDMISVDTDPSAPPYEIWVYNEFPTTNQTNVRFLFYEPGLGTNFQLLHSTARGEINNPQWQLVLYKNAPTEIEGNNYIDGTQMQNNFNRHASRYFNEF